MDLPYDNAVVERIRSTGAIEVSGRGVISLERVEAVCARVEAEVARINDQMDRR